MMNKFWIDDLQKFLPGRGKFIVTNLSWTDFQAMFKWIETNLKDKKGGDLNEFLNKFIKILNESWILKELRADPGFADLPILMLTARGQARDREMAEGAGVSRFMTKPFSNAEMLEAVQSLTTATPTPS